MTVAELIARLQTLPPDAPVLMRSDGDRQYSEAETVVLYPDGDVVIEGN